MTAKIWISIIAGAAIIMASAVALVYSLWPLLLLPVGVCLMGLGFAAEQQSKSRAIKAWVELSRRGK